MESDIARQFLATLLASRGSRRFSRMITSRRRHADRGLGLDDERPPKQDTRDDGQGGAAGQPEVGRNAERDFHAGRAPRTHTPLRPTLRLPKQLAAGHL